MSARWVSDGCQIGVGVASLLEGVADVVDNLVQGGHHTQLDPPITVAVEATATVVLAPRFDIC